MKLRGQLTVDFEIDAGELNALLDLIGDQSEPSRNGGAIRQLTQTTTGTSTVEQAAVSLDKQRADERDAQLAQEPERRKKRKSPTFVTVTQIKQIADVLARGFSVDQAVEFMRGEVNHRHVERIAWGITHLRHTGFTPKTDRGRDYRNILRFTNRDANGRPNENARSIMARYEQSYQEGINNRTERLLKHHADNRS